MDIGGEGVLPVEHNDCTQPSNLNISDVIDAIAIADPVLADPVFGGEVEMPQQQLPHVGAQPYVRIVEQPAGKALRFRYECEGRSAGSIPGSNSTPERKTYPTIEIRGHRGQAIIVVSCVTREEPYKPHPHNLVGRERCENGVCTVRTTITEDNPQVSFSNLGIQCVKRKDIADALLTRQKLRVDPFRTGFDHTKQLQSIDLNAVRLCFQVFIPDESSGRIRRSLPPVVSDVIYDKKAMSDLLIMRVSQCSAPAKGGTEIILLCERITREDIAVVFFEKEGEQVVWEESANIVLVHRQYAIAFQTPPYRRPAARDHVQVYIQLKRTSDNARSNALPFEFIPDYQDTGYLKHKRQKTLSPVLQHYDQSRGFQDEAIKSEPREKSSPHHMGSPLQVLSPPYEQEQVQEYQWAMQGPPIAGSSHVTYAQDVQWSPNYMQLGNLPPVSPNMQAMSPRLHQNIQTLSPHMQMGHVSPAMGHVSPAMEHVSPAMGHVSPAMGHVSPAMGHVSLGLAHRSPAMGHVSPNLEHMSPNMMHQTDLMETGASDPPSLSRLLERSEMAPFNSGELSGLAELLDRGPDLSDSLNRLSTSDLLDLNCHLNCKIQKL